MDERQGTDATGPMSPFSGTVDDDARIAAAIRRLRRCGRGSDLFRKLPEDVILRLCGVVVRDCPLAAHKWAQSAGYKQVKRSAVYRLSRQLQMALNKVDEIAITSGKPAA